MCSWRMEVDGREKPNRSNGEINRCTRLVIRIDVGLLARARAGASGALPNNRCSLRYSVLLCFWRLLPLEGRSGLERTRGVERPWIERAGPLLGGELGEFRQRVDAHAAIAQRSTKVGGADEVLETTGRRSTASPLPFAIAA